MGQCPALGRLSSVKVTKAACLSNLPASILEADPSSPPYGGDSTAFRLRPSEQRIEEQGTGAAGRGSQKTGKKKRSQN